MSDTGMLSPYASGYRQLLVRLRIALQQVVVLVVIRRQAVSGF